MPRNNKINNIAVVDLFCGIGGLSHGFIQEKFKVVAGIDIDPSCKYAFEANNNAKFIQQSVHDISSTDINILFGNHTKILVGCAPCQPFSKYKTIKGRANDEKWSLLKKFAEYITEIQPTVISMENVPQLRKHQVFLDFIDVLKQNNYYVSNAHKVVYCPDYGIPQKRKRLVLLASKLGEIELIPPTHQKYITVKDTIQKLPPIKAGEICNTDKLHRAQKLAEINIKRLNATKEGGSWRDWDKSLQLKCHQALNGRTFGDVYGRMKWNEPAPTMTTHCIGLGNGRFGHPEQLRAISLREAALFQTFPMDYKFVEEGKSFNSTHIQRHIGNAVPVRLGQVIAQSIKQHLLSHNFKN